MAEVLSLNTARERRVVGIDGKAYEMLDSDELPLALALGLSGIAKKCQEAVDNPDSANIADLIHRLKMAARIILPSMPNEVAEKLTDKQRLNLLTAFCTAPAKPATEGQASPAMMEAKS